MHVCCPCFLRQSPALCKLLAITWSLTLNQNANCPNAFARIAGNKGDNAFISMHLHDLLLRHIDFIYSTQQSMILAISQT